MKIMAYNRVIKDLHGLSFKAFLKKVGEKFELEATKSTIPPGPNHFRMFSSQGWFALKAKPGSYIPNDPVASLDIQILQNNLFEPILDIKDPRRDNRINFVGGIRGPAELEKLVNSGQYALGFLLHPTTIEQLMTIADAGKIMPPKSTWFEPKLRSGFVVHLLSD